MSENMLIDETPRSAPDFPLGPEPVAVTETGPASVATVHELYDFSGDQTCTIRVEDTIFKVHRYLLTRDSVFFRDMFSFEQPSSPQELKKIPELIQLQDTAQQFSILCWGLYALPTDLGAQMSKDAFDFTRITNLLRIANKYQFLTLEAWGADVLEHHITNHNLAKTCSFDELSILAEVAFLSTAHTLQTTLENHVTRGPPFRLRADDVPWDSLLPTFDRYSTRLFRGKVYYSLLMAFEKAGHGIDPESRELASRFPFQLTKEQKDHLRSGYWSLSRFWTAYSASNLREGAGCQNHVICNHSWQELLSKRCEDDGAGASFLKVDLSRRLGRAERHLRTSQRHNERQDSLRIHDTCLTIALENVDLTKQTMLQNLPEWFCL